MWSPIKAAGCWSLSCIISWLIMNFCNLIQLKMTFIKLQYLLEHELLALSAQEDVHMESPECFCSSATGSNSRGSFPAGAGNVPAPVGPCVPHVLQCMDSPQDARTQDQEKQNPLGWERHWNIPLLSWMECCLHLLWVLPRILMSLLHRHEQWMLLRPPEVEIKLWPCMIVLTQRWV